MGLHTRVLQTSIHKKYHQTVYVYLTVQIVQIVQRSNYDVDLTNLTDYYYSMKCYTSLIAVSFHSSPSAGYSSTKRIPSFTLFFFLFLLFLLIEGIARLVRHLTLIENISVVSFVILIRVICTKNEWSLAPDDWIKPSSWERLGQSWKARGSSIMHSTLTQCR